MVLGTGELDFDFVVEEIDFVVGEIDFVVGEIDFVVGEFDFVVGEFDFVVGQIHFVVDVEAIDFVDLKKFAVWADLFFFVGIEESADLLEVGE